MKCCPRQDLALAIKRYGPKFVQCISCGTVLMREHPTNRRVPYGRVAAPGKLKLAA